MGFNYNIQIVMEIDTPVAPAVEEEGAAAPDELALLFEEAEDLLPLQKDRSVQMFASVLASERDDDIALRLKEQAIIK